MANQKSYRKFLATGATAAMVATAVVPAASFAAESTPFKDVSSNYSTAVNYLYTNGITSGKTQTTFGTYDSLTRGDAAVIIAKALKLDTANAKDAGFKDVNSRVKGAVNALVEKGIISGYSKDEFKPAEALTRGAMAKILANAYGFADYAKATPFKDVSSTFKPFVEALYGAGITGGKTPTTYGTDLKITRGDFANLLYKSIKFEAPVAKVVSVSAVNAKSIKVTFSKAVDKDTVVDASDIVKNITIAEKGTAPAVTAAALKGSLSKDGKELTITAGTTEFFNGVYTVSVDDAVLTTKGEALTPFVANVTVDDTVAPTVTSAVYNQETDQFEVSFSEPIKAAPSVVRVNGEPVSSVDLDSTGTLLTFDRPATVATGSAASLYINSASDYNDNDLTSYTGNVTVKVDTSALTVSSITQVNSNTVRVKFNRAVAGADTTATAANVSSGLTTLFNGAAVSPSSVTATSGDTTNTSFDVSFASATLYAAENNADVTFAFAKDGITDVLGNKNGAYTQVVRFTKDVVAPTLVSTSVSSDKTKIVLTFSEAVTPNTANFTVRNDGVNVPVGAGGVTVNSGTDTKTVEITKTGGGTLDAGTYTLRLEAGAVTDSPELNPSALITTTATVPAGSVTPTTLAATITNVNVATNGNEFKVAFADAGTPTAVTSSALSASNYKLDGKALPTGTDIYFEDSTKKAVIIKLPANSVNFGVVHTGANAVLSVSGVQSVSGKTVAATSSVVKVEDNTSAILTSAQKVGNTLVLTFNESLDNTAAGDANIDEVLANYDIKAGGTSVVKGSTPGVATASLVAGTTNKVQITFSTTTGTNYDASKTITVTTKDGGDLVDANGFGVKVGTTVTAN